MRTHISLTQPMTCDGSPVTMRLLDSDQDISAVCQLFFRVFGHSVSAEQWRWKYMQAPGSSHYHALAVDESRGQLLGHMGVVMVPGVRGGEPIRMAHACDLMISPQARAGIGPDSVYRHIMHLVRTVAHDPAISPDGAPELFMYGFPGKRPGTLATRLGIQRLLQVCTQYTLPPPREGLKGWWMRHNPWRLRARPLPATEEAWSSFILDVIWQRHAQDLAQKAQNPAQEICPAIVKNAAYLRWRYLHHPLQWEGGPQAPLYTLWLIGGHTQTPLGWVVTRLSPQPIVVDSCLPESAAFAALQALPPPAQGAWTSWLQHSHAQAEETPIWATAMCGAEFHDQWSSPIFQPGDTDVF